MATLSDMGGRRELFGPVPHDPDEPLFHADWERRVFGATMFVSGLFVPNLDRNRYAMERLPRDVYLSSYYRRWLGSLEADMTRRGYFAQGEVEARIADGKAITRGRRAPTVRRVVFGRVYRSILRPKLPRLLCKHVLSRVTSTARPALSRPRYAEGTRVRVLPRRIEGHTRQPGYVTGKAGVVTAHLGAMTFPDARAEGRRTRPQHLYNVVFDGGDLWGPDAEPGTEVRVDLFESYLEPA